MDLTRRSFLKGLGTVAVGLLFVPTLDWALESLEQALVTERAFPDQLPVAVDISVSPSVAFRAKSLIIPDEIASSFLIERICVGNADQLLGTLPGDLFSAHASSPEMCFDTALAGTEISFRVRYIGEDPFGVRFVAALLGENENGGRRCILGIDSGHAIAPWGQTRGALVSWRR